MAEILLKRRKTPNQSINQSTKRFLRRKLFRQIKGFPLSLHVNFNSLLHMGLSHPVGLMIFYILEYALQPVSERCNINLKVHVYDKAVPLKKKRTCEDFPYTCTCIFESKTFDFLLLPTGGRGVAFWFFF
jgi:hypothetical protein